MGPIRKHESESTKSRSGQLVLSKPESDKSSLTQSAFLRSLFPVAASSPTNGQTSTSSNNGQTSSPISLIKVERGSFTKAESGLSTKAESGSSTKSKLGPPSKGLSSSSLAKAHSMSPRPALVPASPRAAISQPASPRSVSSQSAAAKRRHSSRLNGRVRESHDDVTQLFSTFRIITKEEFWIMHPNKQMGICNGPDRPCAWINMDTQKVYSDSIHDAGNIIIYNKPSHRSIILENAMANGTHVNVVISKNHIRYLMGEYIVVSSNDSTWVFYRVNKP